MQTYSEEQIGEFKEVFSLFDKKGNGTIEPDALGDTLRSIGQNPTQAQVAEIIAALPDKGAKPLSFELFLDILSRPDGFKAAGTTEEFVQGFHVFDKDGTGYISAGELRYVLTSLGEKLTDAEVDELLKYVEVSKDGMVHYEDFVRAIASA
ncbi:myosin II light chain [Blastocladiella emersonii ATCC 22665]|nr:myosin II light chain [Blastocladiella emersonii ATCC 22665]